MMTENINNTTMSDVTPATETVDPSTSETSAPDTHKHVGVIAACVGGVLFAGAVAALLVHKHHQKKLQSEQPIESEEPEEPQELQSEDIEVIESQSEATDATESQPECDEDDDDDDFGDLLWASSPREPRVTTMPTYHFSHMHVATEDLIRWSRATCLEVEKNGLEATVRKAINENRRFEGVGLIDSCTNHIPLTFEEMCQKAEQIIGVHEAWIAGHRDIQLRDIWVETEDGKWKYGGTERYKTRNSKIQYSPGAVGK